MKRFLVLSAIVAMAGVGIGVARQHQSATTTVEAAAATSSTTATTDLAASPSTPTQKVAAKPTPATARKAPTPTTPTTSRAGATTTTTVAPVETFLAEPTTTTTARAKPTCTLAVEKPTVAPGEDQVVRLTSNMHGVSATIHVGSRYSPSTQTDSTGNASWQIKAPTTPGVVSVTTMFSFPLTGQNIGSVCSSSFVVAS